MDQLVRALTTIVKGQSSNPSTHMVLTTTHNEIQHPSMECLKTITVCLHIKKIFKRRRKAKMSTVDSHSELEIIQL